MAMAGPDGELVKVAVATGILVAVNVRVCVGDGMPVELAVAVGTTGVDEALVTPITAGVGVKIDGVKVAGKKGVGPGWITQPLQDDNRIVIKSKGIARFIFSPLAVLYPA